MLSGGVTALGAHHEPVPFTGALLLKIVLGTLMAAILNGASNGINQIYDLAIDRVNNRGGRSPPAGCRSAKPPG